MPGTNLAFAINGLEPEDVSRCASAQEQMLHYPFYAAKSIFCDRYLALGRTGYEGYPYFADTDARDLVVALEGKIYGKTNEEIVAALGSFCGPSIDEAGLEGALREFSVDSDGEYVGVVYDKARSILLVFSDPQGRLPLYYHYDGARLLLSRETKFIFQFLAGPRFDKRGAMEYLLFGSPLGGSTLLEGVRSFRAGSWLLLGRGKGLTTGVYAQSFLEAPQRRDDPAMLAEEISTCFLESLRIRVEAGAGRRPVLSLSGGLDSRAVLAGLCRLDADPLAVTTLGPEEESARAVAKRFGVEIMVLGKAESSTPADCRRFILMKDGLDCHPGLPRLYAFMEDLLQSCGRDITYYTGIMGGEITRHYNPTSGLGTVDRVARHVLHTKASYKYSTSKVAAILGMTKTEILEHMVQLIGRSPESASERKYIAFRHEIYRRYTGEAEDRNRFYCWTVSPFYAMRFFQLMMSIDERRKGIRLWRDVLRIVDPRSCKDPYFNRGVSLESELGLALISAGERVIRVAALKRMAQALVYRVSEMRARLAAPGACPEREELLGMLDDGRGSSSLERAASIFRTETDMLGIERMHALCTYGTAAGILGSLS